MENAAGSTVGSAFDEVSEWFAVFFLAYRCVLGFAAAGTHESNDHVSQSS